jgi:acyl dehydratase
MPFYTAETVQALINTEVGVSDWVTITQDMVNQFAKLTGDPVEIHTNVELAKHTPFGGTIAHGLLTLSMIGGLCTCMQVYMQGINMGLNYGFNKVRMISPVKTGSCIRGRFTLKAMEQKGPKQWLQTTEVVIEIEGEDKPALIAEWLGMQFVS